MDWRMLVGDADGVAGRTGQPYKLVEGSFS